MVIFRDETERMLFLVECGKNVFEADSQDDHHLFIKKRKQTVEPIKSYWRRQSGLHTWIGTRLKNTWAIRKWHHSPEGRRRHRQLGRYLSTRNVPTTQMQSLRRDLVRESLCFNSVEDQVLLELAIDQLSSDIQKQVLG